MALRIPWDKKETALLIDAYLRVKDKKLSEQDAIKETSHLLRQRAIISGVEIDEIFRNENGISMQMKIIAGLIDEKPSGLHSATRLFTEMVALYKTCRTEFDEILNQAKGECVMQVNVQEEFFVWLSARVSPAQLSEFYIVCRDIETFCMDRHILMVPLFETTDFEILEYIANTIRNNKIFKFKYYSQIGKMKKVMDYYLTFLRENPIQENIQAEKVNNSVVTNKGINKTDVTINISVPEEQEEKSSNKPVGNEQVIFNDVNDEKRDISTASVNENNRFVWNFANNGMELNSINPKEVVYFGDSKVCDGWKNAFLQIITLLYEDYPAIIRGMVGYRLREIDKVILYGRAGLNRFLMPEILDDGLYLELECNPEEIVTSIRVLMDKCNMDYDNVEIVYEKNQSQSYFEGNVRSEKSEIPDVDDTNNAGDVEIREDISKINVAEGKTEENIFSVYEGKFAFEKWLTTKLGLAEASVRSYSSAINVAGQYSVQLGFSDRELYFISNSEKIYQISKKLLANQEFAQMNDEQHNRYRSALSKYWNYCKSLSDGNVENSFRKSTPDQEDEIKKNRISFISWAQSQQIQMATILADLSDIKRCSEYARAHNYIKKHLLLIEDAKYLEHILYEMQKDKSFIELDIERHKGLVSAMNKLIIFRKATQNSTQVSGDFHNNTLKSKTGYQSNVIDTTVDIDLQVKEKYAAILAKNFEDGFRPAKAIDRNRFRMYFNDMFGDELIEDDERLVRTLMKIGTLRDERIFVKDETEQKDLIEEINETIMVTFKEGASCIYIECLFNKFQDQLAEMLHVYNVDSLENMLFNSSRKRNYFKRYNYLFGYNREPSPVNDVIEYMKKSHLPVTYTIIENELWYIPLDKIKHTLVTTPEIVNVASEAYLYAPNLPVNEEELNQITDAISGALLQRSYLSDVELMSLIESDCPSVLMNTPDYPMWGLRNALAYLLREKFSFRGAIISNIDEEISMAEVFSDFCQHSEHITIEELKKFANELKTVIYWDSVYDEMIRVNQSEFICHDQIHFNIEQTDQVLEQLIQNEYTPIKSINLFLHFPAIDIPWNNFVLESYVANYSKKFRLLHASYTATDCCGAIVRRDCNISDYRTLIVDVLTNNVGWKTKKDALQLLVDLGYQQRRSYSDIENVMQEANARMRAHKK